MPVAVPLPEFVTSRRHRVTAGVGLAVIAALAGAAATLAPAGGAPVSAAPVAATVAITGDRSAAADRTEREAVATATAATPAPPATTTTAVPNGPAVTALAAQGIPIVALEAYRKSADLQATEAPACHLSWTLVAAIGAIESGHGTHGGAQLYADGQDLPHVIGPVLDGSAGNAVITDTDQGRYDADPVHDRAVGPMQFIPSTWARIGRDASGDGVADPFNIIDAAAATGAYLCRYGQDLGTDAGRTVAVFGYNHLDSYVATVLALDAAYAGRPVVTTSTAPAAPPAASPAPVAPVPSSSSAPSSAAPAPSSAAPAPSSSAPPSTAPTTPAPSPTCPTTTPTDPASPTGSPTPLPSGCPTPSSAPASVTPSSSATASDAGTPSATPDATPTPTA